MHPVIYDLRFGLNEMQNAWWVYYLVVRCIVYVSRLLVM